MKKRTWDLERDSVAFVPMRPLAIAEAVDQVIFNLDKAKVYRKGLVRTSEYNLDLGAKEHLLARLEHVVAQWMKAYDRRKLRELTSLLLSKAERIERKILHKRDTDSGELGPIEITALKAAMIIQFTETFLNVNGRARWPDEKDVSDSLTLR